MRRYYGPRREAERREAGLIVRPSKAIEQTEKGRDSRDCPYLLYVLIIYVVVLYGVWTPWEFWVKPFLDVVIPNKLIGQVVKSGIIKNLIWTVPAVLLIRYFQSDMHIVWREMIHTKVNWLKYLPVFAGFTTYIMIGAVIKNGSLALSEEFGVDKLIVVLFVGLTEEMVFRGWLLNATIREEKKWAYIFLNAVMFLAIHFPVWIHTGTFINNFVGLGFLEILALSVIFSVAFLKSRSIFVPIALHMYWDLLVFLLFNA